MYFRHFKTIHYIIQVDQNPNKDLQVDKKYLYQFICFKSFC
jgi:hypothetical protein